MKSRLLDTVCVGVIACVINTSGNAADYTFTKIFDSNDPLPNGMGNFTEFNLPSLDGRNIAFAGRDGTPGPFGSFTYTYSGVYTIIDRNLNLVVDSNNSIPGGTGNFEWLAEPIIDGNNVAFAGGNRDTNQNGIYTDLGGSVRVVADLNTQIPGGTGTFGFLPDEDFGISNGVVALTGGASPAQLGVYADINGNLSAIVDQNTPAPAPDGSGDFVGGVHSGMNGSDVAFSGGNLTVRGQYLNSSGTISTIIDTNTLIPGSSTETFSFPSGEVDVAGGTFVIANGPDNAQLGLYSNVGGTLHLVAAIGDTTPDGVGSFTFFDNLAVDGDELAFTAVEDSTNGNIFRYAGGTLDEVISIGALLDGKTVIDLNMWDDGFDASAIAFQVDFEDGSSGIYLAEVVASTGSVDLNGTVQTTGGTPLCSMVLASGQFMFTCNPNGPFSLLDLPRGNDGTVKRQIYVDGFFPAIDILPGSVDETVVMTRSGTCPNYNIPYDPAVVPGSAGKRIDISGKVLLQNSQTPICAMVLANGQYMFSCDGAGSYALNIPLDNNGRFKLQVYADGFAPTIQAFDEFQDINDVRMARAVECQ